jgi:hypothetical protein
MWVCLCFCLLASITRHANRTSSAPHYIAICGLSRPALPYFSTLSHKRQDFREKNFNTKCVLRFSLHFCLKTFSFSAPLSQLLSWTTWVFMLSPRYFCHNLVNLGFSVQIFGISSNIKFREYPTSGIRVIPCGWTRQDMAKLKVTFFFKFCESAW